MSVPFFLFLAVLGFEYSNGGQYLPLWNALSLSLVIAVGLLVYASIKGEVKVCFQEKQTILLLVLLAMTLVSPLHALVRIYSINVLRSQIGYFVLLLVCAFFLSDIRRVRIYAWFMALVHVGLVIDNREKMFEAIRVGGYQAGYFMSDGNDFGWELNIVLPITGFLIVSARSLLPRITAIASFLTIAIGIMGTTSRGAALTMVSAVGYFIVMSRRKVLGALIAILVGIGILIVAPSGYIERLETIGSYTEDTSAQGRLEAWGAATRMALDYPLGVGAGNFNSAYGRYYRSDEFNSRRWISAHSIYFVVLGEYGVLGFVVLVATIVVNVRENHKSLARIRNAQQSTVSPLWPICLNMSVIAFAVGGCFLGGLHYPHIYMLSGLTIGTTIMTCQLGVPQSEGFSRHLEPVYEKPAAGPNEKGLL